MTACNTLFACGFCAGSEGGLTSFGGFRSDPSGLNLRRTRGHKDQRRRAEPPGSTTGDAAVGPAPANPWPSSRRQSERMSGWPGGVLGNRPPFGEVVRN